MLIDVLFGGKIDLTYIISLLLSVFAVVYFTLPLHEWAHAFVATKLGDPTPKYQGRLTINPLKHIDLYGALMILIVGIGWAKPVNVDMRYFKKPKRDMALVAAAGPIMNFLVSFVLIFLFNVLKFFNLPNIIYLIIYYFAYINISLAIFNLIPIPPLDGSRILNLILPDRIYYKIMQNERLLFVLLLFLLLFINRTGIFGIIVDTVFIWLSKLAALPFLLFIK